MAKPRYEEWGTSMGNALRSILIRLVAYLAVAIAAGLLFLGWGNGLSVDVAEARSPPLANE